MKLKQQTKTGYKRKIAGRKSHIEKLAAAKRNATQVFLEEYGDSVTHISSRNLTTSEFKLSKIEKRISTGKLYCTIVVKTWFA